MRRFCAGILLASAGICVSVAADLSINQNQTSSIPATTLPSNAGAAIATPQQQQRPSAPPTKGNSASPKELSFWLDKGLTVLISAVTALVATYFSERKKRK